MILCCFLIIDWYRTTRTPKQSWRFIRKWHCVELVCVCGYSNYWLFSFHCHRMEDWRKLVSWTYSGINYSLAGNGGPECAAMVPGTQRIAETVFVVVTSCLELWLTYPRLKLPNPLPLCNDRVTDGGFGRRILLLIMCLTFGIELGFKFASRQMIWILNPCHIVTMMQVRSYNQN